MHTWNGPASLAPISWTWIEFSRVGSTLIPAVGEGHDGGTNASVKSMS